MLNLTHANCINLALAGAGQPHTSAAVDIRAYLSFLFSLVIGNAKHLRPSEQWPSVCRELSSKENELTRTRGRANHVPVAEQFWSTHLRIVKLASDCLATAHCGSTAGGTFLSLLAPAIQRELLCLGPEHPGGARAWYGLLASAACTEPGNSDRGECCLSMSYLSQAYVLLVLLLPSVIASNSHWLCLACLVRPAC